MAKFRRQQALCRLAGHDQLACGGVCRLIGGGWVTAIQEAQPVAQLQCLLSVSIAKTSCVAKAICLLALDGNNTITGDAGVVS
jgi:hypothetical protein